MTVPQSLVGPHEAESATDLEHAAEPSHRPTVPAYWDTLRTDDEARYDMVCLPSDPSLCAIT